MNSSEKRFQAGIIIGALLAATPVLGFLGTAYGMFRSFGALSDSGLGDPQTLSRGVGLALRSTAAGIVLCPVGVIILVLSLVMRARVRRGKPPSLPSIPPP